MKRYIIIAFLLAFATATPVQAGLLGLIIGRNERSRILYTGNAATLYAAHNQVGGQSGPIVIAYPPMQSGYGFGGGYPQQPYFPQQPGGYNNYYQNYYGAGQQPYNYWGW